MGPGVPIGMRQGCPGWPGFEACPHCPPQGHTPSSPGPHTSVGPSQLAPHWPLPEASYCHPRPESARAPHFQHYLWLHLDKMWIRGSDLCLCDKG